jgi:drug/metabolite transporter (DMT)-like permease
MTSSTPSTKIPSNNKLMQKSVMIALFCIYIIWGATNLGNRVASQSFPPFLLVGLRLMLATIFLMGFLRYRGTPFPSERLILNATVIGALMFGGRAGFLAFARSQGVGSGLLGLGVATVPLWAMMFAFIFGYRPGRLEILGLVIGIAGIAILNIGNTMQFQAFGIFALLFAPMIWAFGSYYRTEIAMPRGLMATAFHMLGGCITLLMLSFIAGEQVSSVPSLPSIMAFLFLSLPGTLVAFSAYIYLVDTVSPGLATSYAYVNPVVAIIFDSILSGIRLQPFGMVAMVVIAVSVVLIMVGKSQASDA